MSSNHRPWNKERKLPLANSTSINSPSIASPSVPSANFVSGRIKPVKRTDKADEDVIDDDDDDTDDD